VFFWVRHVLGFELMASCRWSSAWAMLSALFSLVILEIGSGFCPALDWPTLQSSFFTLPTIAGMKGHNVQLWKAHPLGQAYVTPSVGVPVVMAPDHII
jgi:hypothetical protein